MKPRLGLAWLSCQVLVWALIPWGGVSFPGWVCELVWSFWSRSNLFGPQRLCDLWGSCWVATLMVLLTWGAVLVGNLLAADETRGSLVEGGFARGQPSGLEWGLPGCVLGLTLMVFWIGGLLGVLARG